MNTFTCFWMSLVFWSAEPPASAANITASGVL